MQLIIEIDDELHRQFKSKCALNGISMSEIMKDKISDFVKNDKR